MNIVQCKRGDTGIRFTNPRAKLATATTPAVVHEPLTIDGEPFDLTDCTVKFLLKMIESPYTEYSFTASIDGDPTIGDVEYVRGAGFPIVLGKYKQEWEITQPDNSIITCPTEGHNIVEIIEDLNPDPYTIVITDSGSNPISGCECWVTENENGTEPLTPVLVTNAAGEVEFFLLPGTYWLFRQKAKVTFAENPKEITVV